jgi:hypothetical protein
LRVREPGAIGECDDGIAGVEFSLHPALNIGFE